MKNVDQCNPSANHCFCLWNSSSRHWHWFNRLLFLLAHGRIASTVVCTHIAGLHTMHNSTGTYTVHTVSSSKVNSADVRIPTPFQVGNPISRALQLKVPTRKTTLLHNCKTLQHIFFWRSHILKLFPCCEHCERQMNVHSFKARINESCT